MVRKKKKTAPGKGDKKLVLSREAEDELVRALILYKSSGLQATRQSHIICVCTGGARSNLLYAWRG